MEHTNNKQLICECGKIYKNTHELYKYSNTNSNTNLRKPLNTLEDIHTIQLIQYLTEENIKLKNIIKSYF